MNFRRILSRLGHMAGTIEKRCQFFNVAPTTTPAHRCYVCGSGVRRPIHADRGPDRVYCDTCAACSRYNPDDRCDVCFHRYFGGAL